MDGAKPAVESGWGDFRKGGELLFGVAFHDVILLLCYYCPITLVLYSYYVDDIGMI